MHCLQWINKVSWEYKKNVKIAKKRALKVRELPTVLKPKKAKTVLESLKMVNNEMVEGSTKWSIKLKRLKLVQHCSQLPIAKNESFFKTAVTFLVYDNMFVDSYCTT